MQASAKELRLHTAELLAATDRGEEVVITWRGRARARLVPIDSGDTGRPAEARNPAFGLWQERDETPDDYVRALRNGRSFA